MKHLLRDIVINLFTYTGATAIYRRRWKKYGPLVRVVSFHDVADREWFAKVLDLFLETTNVVTPNQFLKQDFKNDQLNLLITFDDGYQTWVDNCLPELKKRGIQALFFINSGLLDVAEDEEKAADFYQSKVLISPKDPLTWEGVRQLKAAGHTIGSHTVNHVRMSQISLEQATEEVVSDVGRLVEVLSEKITTFAYPFGTKSDYSSETVDMIKDLSLTQFSAVSSFVRPEDIMNKNLIPRTLIENNQSPQSITQWLHGSYDLFARLNYK